MKERLNNISLIRLLSCILIFAFHMCLILSPMEGKTFFPMYIGVGIFTFVSAFLYSGKKIENKKEFFAKNRKKILIPVAVFFVLYAFAVIISFVAIGNFSFEGFTNLVTGTTKAGHFIIGIMNLWYVPVILLCYLFLPSLYKIFYEKSKISKFYIYLAVALELLIACFFKNPLTFSLFFIGYIFGYFYKAHTEKFKEKKVELTICALVLFLVSWGAYYCAYNLIGTSNYFVTIIKNFLCEVLGGLMATGLTIFLFQIFAPLNKSTRMANVFKITDKVTYEIYIVHQALMIGTISLLAITPILGLNIFITMCVTVVFAIVVEILSTLIIKKMASRLGDAKEQPSIKEPTK